MAASEPDATARSVVNVLLPYTTKILCVDNSLFRLSCCRMFCNYLVILGENILDVMYVFWISVQLSSGSFSSPKKNSVRCYKMYLSWRYVLNGATDQRKPLANQAHTTSSGVEIFQFMTVVLMNAQVFWGALPCRLANSYWSFGRVFCLQLHGLSVHLLGLRYTVGGGNTLLRNVGNYLPVDTAW